MVTTPRASAPSPEPKSKRAPHARAAEPKPAAPARSFEHVSLLSDFDLHLFNEGQHHRVYEKLGAHPMSVEGVQGTYFAVWAPNASEVAVIGDWNGWQHGTDLLRWRGSSGIAEGFIPGVEPRALYKLSIQPRWGGPRLEKADPYAFAAELRPRTGSLVWDITSYSWGDDEWIEERARRQAFDAPMSAYEVHLGSWRRVPGTNGYLSYADLAEQLAEYCQQQGFTHVELMPVSEHPYDPSWGYQTTGYFAPTSRFGTPDDFKAFVDLLHQAGIGVILDWVPAHFPRDAHGLANFDGTALYEHADPRQGEHPDWGTKVFNFGRSEVRNFLISNALFWIREYHVDGLRVDAVASMLYLDYSREAGEWVPNQYGGRENLDAISFLQRVNEVVHTECPGVLTIAEESTAWPQVTRPPYMGGLGFSLKWNMGWMHDTLQYVQQEPIHRRWHHHEMTFSMLYAFHENFVLPFSHDEVVHGKGNMLAKMPGDDWQKFATLRALLGYMYGHPGKKLLFMGIELGQWREWTEANSLDWDLLQWAPHQGLQRYVADLNAIYRREGALHEVDFVGAGFEWLEASDNENSVFSFLRKGAGAGSELVVVVNFTPVPRVSYRVPMPRGGKWYEVLNSDSELYGGGNVGNGGVVTAEEVPWGSQSHSACLTVPPLGALYLVPAG